MSGNKELESGQKVDRPVPPGSGGEPAPLEIHDLTVAYHKKPVLWGIDLVVPPGQLVGIVGPNGAGKSTLIKAVMGLLPLNSGWVKVFGQPIRRNLTRVGYVPQRESVDWDFPVSVMDVVLMGRYGQLGLLKRPSKHDRDVACECLEKVKMLPYASRQISNLSGGQQQRVFLARALAQESDLYFMDEPFSGGVKRGGTYAGLLETGLDIDSEKLFGIKGNEFHVSALYPHGGSISEYSGDLSAVSNIDAYDTVRLFEIWVQQRFWRDRVSLRLGQLAADEEFAVAEHGAVFINSATLALDETAPTPPTPTRNKREPLPSPPSPQQSNS